MNYLVFTNFAKLAQDRKLEQCSRQGMMLHCVHKIRAILHEWMRTQGLKIFHFHCSLPTLHGPVKTGFQLASIGSISSFCVYNRIKIAPRPQ